MPDGRLFVFEGPDGVGKSSLIDALATHLQGMRISCDTFSFPGREKGTLGEHVYYLHHNWRRAGIVSLNPASLQILHIAAHVDLIEARIIPAIKGGRIVLLDRFWWSTWVYGKVHGVPIASLEAMINVEQVHWDGVVPDAVLLIRTSHPHRADVDDPQWNQIREAYEALAHRESQRYPVYSIDNSGPPSEAMTQVLGIVNARRTTDK